MEESKKIAVIKENHLFSKVYGKGKCFVTKALAVYVLKNYNKSETLVGFTVSKSRGNAVKRNLIRRRIREAYRTLYPFVKKGYLIVIVARGSCERFSSTVLCDQLHDVLRRAALLSD